MSKETIMAWSLKERATVKMLNPRIEMNERGGYWIKGTSELGNNLAVSCKEDRALALIASGSATKGF